MAGANVTRLVDDRSPMAKAMSKVSEIIAICLMMVIPALIGYWGDQKLGTGLLFTLTGLMLGMLAAILQLKRLVSSTNQSLGKEDSEETDETSDES